MVLPRVLSVVGTRPEAIKMAPVIRALKLSGACDHRLVVTGQHTDLVDQVLSTFDIEPDHDLDLMLPGQTLYDIGHACLKGLRKVVADFSPNVTIVQGDTATVFFAGVVTFFERCKLAHVEAGLRSGVRSSPFPEEMLRRMTDVMSDYCFAPTRAAAANLAREGVRAERIFVTGNTVVDALMEMRTQITGVGNSPVSGLLAAPGRIVLLTAHRRESLEAPMERVFLAVAELARRFPDVTFLYPVHPNPRVKDPATRILGRCPGVALTDPLGYQDLIRVLDRAALVMTDSGGIQEEAPAFGVHTLVLRDVTERPEGVEAGAATLVGTDRDRIVREATARLSGSGERVPPQNPYGDGLAGERIADVLLADFAGVPRRLRDWSAP